MANPTADLRARESVAEHFTRFMNASTSRYGVLADLSLTSAMASLPLVLAMRQSVSDGVASPFVWIWVGVALVPVFVSLGAIVSLRGAREKVVAWLAARKFPVENLNTLLVGLGDNFEVIFQDTFPASVPETLKDKLESLSETSMVSEIDEKEQKIVIQIGIFDSKHLPLRTNFQRYARFQHIIEAMLEPLHEQSSIKEVRII
jgi:hypothetical protein